MKIAIISPCTNTKNSLIPQLVTNCEELTSIAWRTDEKYKPFLRRATTVYRGRGFKMMRKAIDKLKEKHEVFHYIMSSGMGIVPEDTMIPNYDCTFTDMPSKQRDEFIASLKINETLDKYITDYDLVITVIGGYYLGSIIEGFLKTTKKRTIVFTYNATEPVIENENVIRIISTDFAEITSQYFRQQTNQPRIQKEFTFFLFAIILLKDESIIDNFTPELAAKYNKPKMAKLPY